MKTITQETIVGQVQEIDTKDDYLVQFVIKTIREGEVAWFNVTANPWTSWNIKEGDEVALTGQLTKSVWQDPFEHEEVEIFEMKVTSLRLAV